MRIIKWIIGTILLIAILAIILVGYFALTFDANSYKDRIIQTVKTETGRDLRLHGELTATFYPWLGVNAKDADLSNAQGFAAEKFLTFEEASVRLQLIPLLKKNIVADRIELKGAELWLARNSDNKTNWDDISERFKSDTQTTDTSSDGMTGSIAGFDLQNALIHWSDAKQEQDMDLSIKHFKTGELKPGTPTNIESEFSFALSQPVVQGQVLVSGVTRLSQFDPFVLSKPELDVNLQGVDVQAENVHAVIDTSEIRYQAGKIALKKPLIQYNISNMPSLGKKALGQITASELHIDGKTIKLPQMQASIDLDGSAFPGDKLNANVRSEGLQYDNGQITLANPAIEYDLFAIPNIGERAKGKLQSSELLYKQGSVTLSNAVGDTELSGSALPGDSLTANLNAEQLSFANSVVQLKNYSSESHFMGDPWPQQSMQSTVSGSSLSFNLDKDSLSMPDFAAKLLDLDIKGSVKGSNVTSDSLSLSGAVTLADFSPKVLAPKLEIELPKMSSEAWTQANLSGKYAVTKNSFAVSDLNTVIDGTRWQGKASIDDLKNKKVSFNLSAASLDANRLLPPKQADALKDKDGSAASEATVNAIEIPQTPLQTWDAQGTLKLGTLSIGKIVTTNLEAGINLLDGNLRIFPSKANFFDGQYSGDIRLDVSGATPHLQADETISNIDIAALGKAMWPKNYMTGRTDGRIVLDTSGATIGAMREAAAGEVQFKVTDGVMQGFDLNYAVANAVSIFRQKTLADVDDTKQTAFHSLAASAKVSSGIMHNDDFLAVMPRMRLRGKGKFNLLDTGINYQVAADVLESKSASASDTQLSLDELVGATIPIKITGTLAKPVVRPDVGAYLKARAEQEVRDRLKKEVEDKLKDKVGDSLGGVLGDILGGKTPDASPPPATTLPPEEKSEGTDSAEKSEELDSALLEPEPEPEPEPEQDPIEQKKEELEQEVKDKLKDLFGG